ncbi:MAG: 5'-3' exonuclease H3TH domain-containing protein [Candidatus Gracilibacteria bacterium]
MRRELIIIDGFNLIFRVFYAVPGMHTKDGKPANALFGYTRALMKLLQTDAAYIVIAFDSGGETFRSEVDENYKAHRDGMPSDLISQMDAIFEVTDLLQIPWMAAPGFEADDIIGTLVRKHEKTMEKIRIVSSDKDLFQFVGGNAYVYDAMKDKEYGLEEVIKKFEIQPSQIVDYLALIGDTSDNIPGVKGIGPKTAIKLLKDYKTLDTILENLSKLSPKLQAMIADGESAKKSQFLATIRTDVPLSVDMVDLAREHSNITYTPELVGFLQQYEFRSLLPHQHEAQNHTFTLKKETVMITADVVQKLLTRIESGENYSFATSGGRDIETYGIAFSSEEIYEGNGSDAWSKELLKSLTEHPYNMTTYDWKTSLRRILFSLKK